MKRSYKFKPELFRKALSMFPRQFSNQSERARILGLSQSTISRLQSGERLPTIEELIAFCSRAGYAPSDFFVLIDPEK